MITEHALLHIKQGQEVEFESAMNQAHALIAVSDGFHGIEVLPCIGTPGQYLLLVKWESVEAHEVGFRGSERYLEWQKLLHRFYEPFPVVQHFGSSVI